ncbi:MAG: hypothetical protein ABSA67_02820 [Candidatus Brocadiia bacterium]|jgi:predicted RNase H-like HicB family nuclease
MMLEREREGCVARCPELDVASQGRTVEKARRLATARVMPMTI